jgi:hypothetical protein
MTKIDKHIEELLYNHDCVIVPDFGGFITSKKPAYFNPFTSVFFPATKKILFNKHLVFNDGLLMAKLAEKRVLSMEESQQLLMEFKDDCFLKLNKEGRVEIEKVGVLFFDKEKNIQFQQASTNFLKDSFGLSVVTMPKLEIVDVKSKPLIPVGSIVRPIETKVDRPVQKKITKQERIKNPNRIGKLIPLLIIPLIVGGIFMISEQDDFSKQNFNLSNFNPFQGKYIQEYTPREGEDFLINSKNFELNESILLQENEEKLEVQVPPVNVAEIKEEIDSTYNEPVVFSEAKNYHVIAGCFSVKENAEGLVSEWINNGNEASIIDKKGQLYRVAIQSFSSREAAQDFLISTKNEAKISLWILKK